MGVTFLKQSHSKSHGIAKNCSAWAYRKHHASRPIIGIVEDNPYRSKSTVQRGGFCNLRGLSRKSAKNFLDGYGGFCNLCVAYRRSSYALCTKRCG